MYLFTFYKERRFYSSCLFTIFFFAGLTLDDMAKVRMRTVAARLEVDFDPVSCVARKRKNLEVIVALSMKNPEIRRNQSELRLSILKIAPGDP